MTKCLIKKLVRKITSSLWIPSKWTKHHLFKEWLELMGGNLFRYLEVECSRERVAKPKSSVFRNSTPINTAGQVFGRAVEDTRRKEAHSRPRGGIKYDVSLWTCWLLRWTLPELSLASCCVLSHRESAVSVQLSLPEMRWFIDMYSSRWSL